MSGTPNLAAGMMTHSGAMVSFHTGVPTLEDIALALSRVPRFGGHCRTPWTVLDHVLVCQRLAEKAYPNDPWLGMACLLHDAHEALTGDTPSPLKVPQLKVLQKQLDVRIMDAHFPSGHAAFLAYQGLVAAIDYRALLAEAVIVGPPGLGMHNVVELFGTDPREDDIGTVRAYATIARVCPSSAIDHFVALARELGP